MARTPRTTMPIRKRLKRIEAVADRTGSSAEDIGASCASMRCADHTAHRSNKVGPKQRLGNDLLYAQCLRGCTVGAQTRPELAGNRDQRRARMRCLYIAYPLRAGLLGHGDTGGHPIPRAIVLCLAECTPTTAINR